MARPAQVSLWPASLSPTQTLARLQHTHISQAKGSVTEFAGTLRSGKRLSAGLAATRRGTEGDIKISNDPKESQAHRGASRRGTAPGGSFGSAGSSGEVGTGKERLSIGTAMNQIEMLKVCFGINDEQVSSHVPMLVPILHAQPRSCHYCPQIIPYHTGQVDDGIQERQWLLDC